MMGEQLIIRRPDDWHVHLRDGAMLGAVTIETARVFARAMVMPNLKNPVVTAKDAAAYRNRIKKAGFGGARFTPMMALYLTDDTNADDLEKAYKGGVVIAAKLYPANATTGAEHGVTDVAKIAGVLARMEKIDMPLLVHGEVVDGDVDVFDREAVFIERVLAGVMKDFPKLRIVFEHITTKDAVDFVTDGPETLAATVTPHHLVINRSDMFKGGIRPHLYCLPVAKRESHRLALRAAAVSGNPKFFLGTDSAPHGIGAKESACGCAGIFNAPIAMEIYATVFEEEGHLARLENFASHFGAEFYGLPVNEESLILERADFTVPEQVDVSGEDAVRPFMAGETLGWRVVGIGPTNKGPVL